LARGYSDFMVQPTYLIFLCLIYPLAGLFIARLTFGYDNFPILFPLVSGFALMGPLTATRLYELSRRREQGLIYSWWYAFGVFLLPALPAIILLGLALAGIFATWLFTVEIICQLIFGNWAPISIGEFAHEIILAASGRALIVVGCGIGLVFATIVLMISVVSLPMLLDRDVSAVATV